MSRTALSMALGVAIVATVGCDKQPRTGVEPPVVETRKDTPPGRDFDDVQIEATHLAGTVHMLTGAGGNIGACVGDDGVLLVDDQFAPLAPKIRAAVTELSGKDIGFVINTHWHGDHTGGNPEFGGGATIVAHANVRKRLTSEQHVRGNVIPALPEIGWPVVTFEQSVTLHFNGEDIRIVHFPRGHTDGDSVVFFTQSNVVHMGDHMFAGRFPFVDVESGGSVAGLTANVASLLETLPPNAVLIPGHGPASTVDDLREFHRMLVETSAHVLAAKRAGKTLEQAQKAGLPAEWQPWASGFIDAPTWIAIVWQSDDAAN